MLKLVMMSLTGLLISLMMACGAAVAPQSEEHVMTAPAATGPPQAASAPTARETLEQAAARLAGGPGAIYVGDLSQLVGPAPLPELGFGPDGIIPLDLLEGEQWIYASDYYQRLIDRANFDNPAQLVTPGRIHPDTVRLHQPRRVPLQVQGELLCA